MTNFNAANMAILNEEWDRIAESLQTAAGLLSDMGLSEASLPADSVLVPVAYYVHRRGLTESYRAAPRDADDREHLKSWVLRSLVQPGVWGSGLDTLLRDLRNAIDEFGEYAFPLTEIEQRMAARGKALLVSDELLQDLLDHRYGQKRTFALLAILFPHVDTRNVHHIDHIYPKALLYRNLLRRADLNEAQIDEIRGLQDSLANLQLLEGPVNVSKSAVPPAEWVASAFPTEDRLSTYLERNAMPWVPTSVHDLSEFLADRRDWLAELIRARLVTTRNVAATDEAEVTWSLPHESATDPADSHDVVPGEPAILGPTEVVPESHARFILPIVEGSTAELRGQSLRVLAGTPARRWITRGTAPAYERLQDELIAQGLLVERENGLEFIVDVDFASASAAASVVTGRSSNGLREWKHASSGVALRDWIGAV